mgnify:CR=1 FL=1
MFDEVLALCMEADINIQNINYQLLQENYSLLLEGKIVVPIKKNPY